MGVGKMKCCQLCRYFSSTESHVESISPENRKLITHLLLPLLDPDIPEKEIKLKFIPYQDLAETGIGNHKIYSRRAHKPATSGNKNVIAFQKKEEVQSDFETASKNRDRLDPISQEESRASVVLRQNSRSISAITADKTAENLDGSDAITIEKTAENFDGSDDITAKKTAENFDGSDDITAKKTAENFDGSDDITAKKTAENFDRLDEKTADFVNNKDFVIKNDESAGASGSDAESVSSGSASNSPDNGSVTNETPDPSSVDSQDRAEGDTIIVDEDSKTEYDFDSIVDQSTVNRKNAENNRDASGKTHEKYYEDDLHNIDDFSFIGGRRRINPSNRLTPNENVEVTKEMDEEQDANIIYQVDDRKYNNSRKDTTYNRDAYTKTIEEEDKEPVVQYNSGVFSDKDGLSYSRRQAEVYDRYASSKTAEDDIDTDGEHNADVLNYMNGRRYVISIPRNKVYNRVAVNTAEVEADNDFRHQLPPYSRRKGLTEPAKKYVGQRLSNLRNVVKTKINTDVTDSVVTEESNEDNAADVSTNIYHYAPANTKTDELQEAKEIDDYNGGSAINNEDLNRNDPYIKSYNSNRQISFIPVKETDANLGEKGVSIQDSEIYDIKRVIVDAVAKYVDDKRLSDDNNIKSYNLSFVFNKR